MPKQKISEFNSNPALNTDIDSINIAEGCSPSGINDAIRELMAQLKDWQSGTSNDPMVIGSSGSLTLNQGTANGVAYLNGSKVVTSGSALTFDGTNLGVGGTGAVPLDVYANSSALNLRLRGRSADSIGQMEFWNNAGSTRYGYLSSESTAITLAGGTSIPLVFATNGSEGMRLTSTGLGIGTSSPSAKLSVKTTGAQVDISTSATDLVFEAIDRTTTSNPIDTKFYTRNGTFQWYNGQYTERMRIDSSGNLGLGVTPSAWQSGFKALDIGTATSLFSSASGQPVLAYNAYYNSGDKYKGTGLASAYEQASGQHRWYTAPSGTAGNAITFTQAMTLDASGNLGVGTTTPYSKLDLGSYGSNSQLSWHQDSTTSYGTLAIQNSSAAVGLMAGLKMGSSSNSFASSISGLWAKSAILLDYGNIKFFTDTADTVSYGTTYTPTERARIDSSGNLLVGTTSTTVSDAGFRYTTNSSGGGLSVVKSGGSWGTTLFVGRTSAVGTGTLVEFWYDGATKGSISTNGSTVAYNTSSDYRLKNSIAPMTGALAKVAQLKPVTYKWNADGSDGEGFIAHELAEVVPQCVTGEKDAVDEEGNPKYQGIDTSFLVATLTAALQELKAEFDAYKASHP
jgi:hypothetical protein